MRNPFHPILITISLPKHFNYESFSISSYFFFVPFFPSFYQGPTILTQINPWFDSRQIFLPCSRNLQEIFGKRIREGISKVGFHFVSTSLGDLANVTDSLQRSGRKWVAKGTIPSFLLSFSPSLVVVEGGLFATFPLRSRPASATRSANGYFNDYSQLLSLPPSLFFSPFRSTWRWRRFLASLRSVVWERSLDLLQRGRIWKILGRED